MFSLQRFFGKDPLFFDLLDVLAQAAHTGALSLEKLIQDSTITANIHDLRNARQRSKEAHEKLSELVVTTFVTSLEREDLETLSTSLYKTVKPMEKFAERFLVGGEIIRGIDFSSQTHVIRMAAEAVVEMVKQLRSSKSLETVRKLNAKLQVIEAEADALEVDLLRDLYKSSSQNAVRIIVARDLYDLLERAVDRCRDVGNVVMNIALKNS